MITSVSSSLPRAVVSLPRLKAAAEAALAHGGSVADLRADAYGHGALTVARAVTEAGASGVVVDPSDRETISREGIAVMDAAECDIDARALFGLPQHPVMSLVGRVLSTKRLLAGEGVSYGYSYRAPADTTVALVTGGYAQGIVRALGNRAQVEVAGTLCPIVGRVAMDVCVVELGTNVAHEGTEVIFFGGDGSVAEQLTVWEDATAMASSELVTAIGQRAPREYQS